MPLLEGGHEPSDKEHTEVGKGKGQLLPCRLQKKSNPIGPLILAMEDPF